MLHESEIEGILESRKQAAKSYVDQEVFHVRQKAREFYEGLPFGNEIAGRSQFILTDVRDKIEALMPALMKVFTAGSKIVDFIPVGPEDELQAKEATILVNHVLMKENPGFSILETAFKDGLLEKVGITRTWAEEVDTSRTEKRTGLLADELAELESDPDIEILEEEQRDLEIADEIITAFDVKIRKNGAPRWKIRIDNVVPENFLIDPHAKRIMDADYVAERMEKSVSQLVDMGIDRDVAENLPTAEIYNNSAITGSTRRDRTPTPDKSDDASRLITIWWEYASIDINEDGMVERWRFLRADSGDILLQEEWDDDWPYQAGTPIPKPHEFYGTSLAEEVMDIQLAKSTILREWLDNLYSLNNQRVKVFEAVPGQVSMDDVLNQDLRQPIRIRSAPGGQADVEPLGNVTLGNDIFQALEYLDSVAEVRTGVSKFGQGLDPNVLHKTPATTAGFMMSLAQEKQALIARVYAETLVKDLCMAIYRLVRRHDSRARVIRLTNNFVRVNPGNWPEEMDLSINVGLGTGNKQQQAANIQQLVGYQVAGRREGLVDLDNLYNTAVTAVEALGFSNPELYFTDPKSSKGRALMQQAQQAQQQQGQDPAAMALVEQQREAEMLKHQREMIKIQAKEKIDRGRLLLDASKIQAELELEEAEIQEKLRLEAQKLIQEAQLDLLKITGELELEGMELGAEISLKQEELRIEERLGGKKIAVNTNVRDPDN